MKFEDLYAQREAEMSQSLYDGLREGMLRNIRHMPETGDAERDHFFYLVAGERQLKFGMTVNPSSRLKDHARAGMPDVHRVYRDLTKEQARWLEDLVYSALSGWGGAGYTGTTGREYFPSDALDEATEFLDSHPEGFEDLSADAHTLSRVNVATPRKGRVRAAGQDTLYVMTGARGLKFGITGYRAASRLGAHRTEGFTNMVRLITHLPEGKAAEVEHAIKVAFSLTDTMPFTRGEEYWPVVWLPGVCDLVDEMLGEHHDRSREYMATIDARGRCTWRPNYVASPSQLASWVKQQSADRDLAFCPEVQEEHYAQFRRVEPAPTAVANQDEFDVPNVNGLGLSHTTWITKDVVPYEAMAEAWHPYSEMQESLTPATKKRKVSATRPRRSRLSAEPGHACHKTVDDVDTSTISHEELMSLHGPCCPCAICSVFYNH